MEEMTPVDDLDAAAACEAVATTHQALLAAEARLLALAAHWADLHNGDALDAAGPSGPGRERARRLGAAGTPLVLEFATAEFGALQQLGFISADTLIRDALNLRHRHPLLWAAIQDGEARVWKGREVARLVAAAGLSLEQAAWVDAQTTTYLPTLPWSRFLDLVTAKIIEADPDAAEARRVSAELDRFVHTGQSTEFGLKVLVAKADAGDVIFFVAMAERIAQILAERGDTDPAGARRAKAIGILATPARALRLLQDHAERDVHPADNDADDPLSGPQCPSCGGTADRDPGNVLVTKVTKLDPASLLPPATLYVHLSEESFRRDRRGVARVEGVGPVTVEQAARFLGHHRVTIKPVLDIPGMAAVDCYEVPDRIREAVHLRMPGDAFPFTGGLTRRRDLDHPTPYLPVDRGGPPGQSDPHTLAPLNRRGHRLKTHGRWRVRVPRPGSYLWRSPHGWHFLVDPDGTKALGGGPAAQAFWKTSGQPASHRPPGTASRVERFFDGRIIEFQAA